MRKVSLEMLHDSSDPCWHRSQPWNSFFQHLSVLNVCVVHSGQQACREEQRRTTGALAICEKTTVVAFPGLSPAGFFTFDGETESHSHRKS